MTSARRRPRRSAGQRASGLAGWAHACWFELALVAAGVLSVGVAWAAARLLAAAGGFAGHPFPLTLAPLSQLWTHAWLTGWGILELYGGNFIGVTGWAGFTFAVLHLIGLTLAIAAVAVALGPLRPAARRPTACHAPRAHRRGGPRPEREAGATGGLGAGGRGRGELGQLPGVDCAGTVLGTGYDAREIAAVLPLGAVLAGRVFGAAALAAAGARGAVPGVGHGDGLS